MTRRARLLLGMALSLSVCTPVSAGILSSLGIVDGVSAYDASRQGTWLQQLDEDKGYPKTAYAPKADMLKPYAQASLAPEVAFALAHGAHIARVEAARALCQDVVDKLLAQWKGPAPQVHVVMTSDPVYGASANFTGDIFVHIGTFNSKPEFGAASVDELALMLGHELGHFLLGHQSRKQFYQQATDLLGTAASIYATTQMVSKSHMVGQTLQVQGDQQAVMTAVVGGLASTMLVADVFAPSWSRDDEEEADMIGVDLARAAGYHIDETQIQDFVNKHSDEETTRAARKEKLKAVSSLMILSAKSGKSVAQATSTFDLVVKIAESGAVSKLIDSLGNDQEHPDAKEREKHLEDYADKVAPSPIPGTKLIPVKAKEFRAIAARPDVQQVVKSAISANQVIEALADYTTKTAAPQKEVATSTGISPLDSTVESGRAVRKKVKDQMQQGGGSTPGGAGLSGGLPSACRGTKAVLASRSASSGPITIDLRFPVDAAPYTWRVRGDWQEISPGCAAGAVQDYDHSAKSDFATLDLMHKIVVEFAATNNAHKIPEVYARYNKLIGTDIDFPDLAVADALVRKDQTAAEVKAADCLVYQDGTLWPTCVQLLGYDPTNSATPAKTPEGQKAFRNKSFDRAFNGLLNLDGMFGN